VVVSGCGSEDTPVEEMIRSKAWSMTEAKELVMQMQHKKFTGKFFVRNLSFACV
jgi:hypothetical protein